MKKLFSLRFLWLIFLDEGGGFFQESIRNFFFNHEKLFFMGKYNKFLFRQKIGSFKRAQKKKKCSKKVFFDGGGKYTKSFRCVEKFFCWGISLVGWSMSVPYRLMILPAQRYWKLLNSFLKMVRKWSIFEKFWYPSTWEMLEYFQHKANSLAPSMDPNKFLSHLIRVCQKCN